MKKAFVVFLMLIIVGVMGYATYLNYFGDKTTHFLIIDINPSIELGLDTNNVITSVTALNEDADILLSDVNLIGMDVADASDLVVSEAIDTGFIDQYSEDNQITISSTMDEDTTRTQLQTRIQDRINTSLASKSVSVVVSLGGLTDELKAKADEYNVSYGKYLLVSRAIALNSALVEADLVKLDVQSIQKEIQSVAEGRRAAIATTTEEQNTMLITEKEQKTSTYKQKVEMLKEQLLNEYKTENKATVTEQQKEQITNNLLEQRKEEVKKYVEDVMNGNKPASTGNTSNTNTNTTTGTSTSSTTNSNTGSTGAAQSTTSIGNR